MWQKLCEAPHDFEWSRISKFQVFSFADFETLIESPLSRLKYYSSGDSRYHGPLIFNFFPSFVDYSLLVLDLYQSKVMIERIQVNYLSMSGGMPEARVLHHHALESIQSCNTENVNQRVSSSAVMRANKN